MNYQGYTFQATEKPTFGLTIMNDVLIVHHSNPLQGAFKNPLRRLEGQICFGSQTEEVISEEFVDIHRSVGYRVLWQA